MENFDDNNKPVTKGLLTAFGARCKELFTDSAIAAFLHNRDRWIIIRTNLLYTTLESKNRFDELYISVKGIAEGVDLETDLVAQTAVDFNIYGFSEYNNSLNFAIGINQGFAPISCAIFFKDTDDKLSIAISLREDVSEYKFASCTISAIASFGNTVHSEVLKNAESAESFDFPSVYKYIDLIEDEDESSDESDEETEELYLPNRIGDIYINSSAGAQFAVQTDENSTQYYVPNIVFNRILNAVKAHKLDRNITIEYDFDNTASVLLPTAYEGNLEEDVITLKAPSLNISGADGTFNQVSVTNGIVTSGSNEPVPVASTTVIGGIKLASDTDISDSKIWVKLDETNKAYIGKDSFTDLIYRVDLNSDDFKNHAADYKNLIVQHVGVTSQDYVNGFFYKSLRSSFQLLGLPNEGEELVNMQHPFIFSSSFGSKLYDYIYSIKSSVDIDGKLIIYIIDNDESDDSSDADEDPMDSYIYGIKNQDGSEYLSFTRTQLLETLGVQVLNYSQWDPDESKTLDDSIFTFLFPDTADYYWKQWEVLAEPQLPPILRYKGEVQTYSQLAAIENPRTGDVWAVIETGGEYFYDEEELQWNLLGKEIPAVYDKKLTIQGDGTTAVEFTANSDLDKTLNIKGSNNIDVTKTAAGEITVKAKGYTYDSDTNSVATGYNTRAIGYNSSASGYGTTASGYASHAEGEGAYGAGGGYRISGPTISSTETTNKYSVSDWGLIILTDVNKIIIFNADNKKWAIITSITQQYGGDNFIITSQSLGDNLDNIQTEILWGAALGLYSHSEGRLTIAAGDLSHAEGMNTFASGELSHAEGDNTLASGESSHAEGEHSIASGTNSHAEGKLTTASGNYSHAEGQGSVANDESAHAEGSNTYANAYSHAEGFESMATGNGPCHAEGSNTVASGIVSHAEGGHTTASGDYSHAEGEYTISSGDYSHVEGFFTIANGEESHAEGLASYENITITGDANATEYSVSGLAADLNYVGGIILYDYKTYHILTCTGSNPSTITVDKTLSATALTNVSARAYSICADGTASHTEGYGTYASGAYSHAEGDTTRASGEASHVEGSHNTASGERSHAEGGSNIASGSSSHAEGSATIASGSDSHTEGSETEALGNYSHAEGKEACAKGSASHAEGHITYALGDSSHAEGSGYLYSLGTASWSANDPTTITLSVASTALCKGSILVWNDGVDYLYRRVSTVNGTTVTIDSPFSISDVSNQSLYRVTGVAYGENSHAEGSNTISVGEASHTEGNSTIALKPCLSVIGMFNVPDSSEYLFIVGNGSSVSSRSNAFAIDKDGNLVLFNNGTPVVLTPTKLAQLIS